MEKHLETILWSGVSEIGLELSDQQRDALLLFWREIQFWNQRIGLVGAKGEELVRKHFLDSLAAVPFIARRIELMREKPGRSDPVSLVDLGSGNGFPGIVLKIALPHVSFTLVERSAKRCGFLKNVAALLPNLELKIIQSDLALVSGQWDIVVSRAFRPLEEEIVQGMKMITKPEGEWILYKGDPKQAMAELAKAGIEGEIFPIAVPGVAEQRCLAFACPLR